MQIENAPIPNSMPVEKNPEIVQYLATLIMIQRIRRSQTV